jgi:hypothetical protein
VLDALAAMDRTKVSCAVPGASVGVALGLSVLVIEIRCARTGLRLGELRQAWSVSSWQDWSVRGGVVATTDQRRKSATRRGQSSGSRSTTRQRGEQTAKTTTRRGRSAHTATVQLPFVTAQFRRPDVHIPDRDDLAGAVNTVRNTVRENLPSREQMAYYGGLGLLAVFAVIEWPVAAAIGVGTLVAQRATERSSRSGSSRTRTAE